MTKAEYEGICPVLGELSRVRLKGLLELSKVTRPNGYIRAVSRVGYLMVNSLTLYDLEIRLQSGFQDWVAEQASFRDISHEEFDNEEELVHGLIESRSEGCVGSASNGLLQVGVCLRV